MATARVRRVVSRAVLAAGVLIVLVWVGVAPAHPASKPFTNCSIVLVGAAPQVPGAGTTPLADTGCILGKCLERERQDDGTSICHYGRSATLIRREDDHEGLEEDEHQRRRPGVDPHRPQSSQRK
jgi:hypothetical protein